MPSPLLGTKCDQAITKEAATTNRGHIAPSAERTCNEANNSATFLTSNMMPQVPELNRGVWGDLEEYCRELVEQGKELYISGGAGGKEEQHREKGCDSLKRESR